MKQFHFDVQRHALVWSEKNTLSRANEQEERAHGHHHEIKVVFLFQCQWPLSASQFFPVSCLGSFTIRIFFWRHFMWWQWQHTNKRKKTTRASRTNRNWLETWTEPTFHDYAKCARAHEYLCVCLCGSMEKKKKFIFVLHMPGSIGWYRHTSAKTPQYSSFRLYFFMIVFRKPSEMFLCKLRVHFHIAAYTHHTPGHRCR